MSGKKKIDHKLMKSIKDAHKAKSPKKKKTDKISKVMHEFKEGDLHSGSKKGPKVTNKRQAVAIALAESRKSKKK